MNATEETTGTTPKIRVYTLKHVKKLYLEATERVLNDGTLALKVKRGEIHKIIPPGNIERGLYLEADIDEWIGNLRKMHSTIEIVA